MNGQLSSVMAASLLWVLAGCAGERPANLGVTNGVLAACPSSPNCISSQTADEQHRIAPLSFTADPETAFAQLLAVLKGRPDTTVLETTGNYLRVELRTTLFIDDAEFLLDREHRLIHVRSASRLGYSDLGKNRRRMEEIRAQFDALGTRR